MFALVTGRILVENSDFFSRRKCEIQVGVITSSGLLFHWQIYWRWIYQDMWWEATKYRSAARQKAEGFWAKMISSIEKSSVGMSAMGMFMWTSALGISFWRSSTWISAVHRNVSVENYIVWSDQWSYTHRGVNFAAVSGFQWVLQNCFSRDIKFLLHYTSFYSEGICKRICSEGFQADGTEWEKYLRWEMCAKSRKRRKDGRKWYLLGECKQACYRHWNRIELQLQGLQGHTSTLCLFISFSELENIGTTDPGNRVSS